MWQWINEILMQFKETIGDKRTHAWFVIIIVGLMARTDTLGVTSIVRALSLDGAAYPLLLHFFRSERVNLYSLEWRWQAIISKLPLLYRVNGMVVMIGDGVKQSKEGRFMPGVKKSRQESENSAKGEYIFGHMFGGVGVVIGNMSQKMYCVLVSLRLRGGLRAIRGCQEDEGYIEESHVAKTIKDAGRASLIFGPTLLLLDRLYLTVPMLKALARENLIKVVTKAKTNCKAYYHPEPKAGPGRKPKKGDKVKILLLFETMAASFVKTKAMMYGQEQEISYYSVNPLWGDSWYQNLKFALIWFEGKKSILVSTDLSLTPIEIIEAYRHRFKIECAFRELKQVIAGFCYRFWSKHTPKLNRFKPNEYHQERQAAICGKAERKCITNALGAIERFALMACIALGLLQVCSILFSETITGKRLRFMRTPS